MGQSIVVVSVMNKETLVLNYDNSRAAINAAVRKATYYDVDCEISEILVRTKL